MKKTNSNAERVKHALDLIPIVEKSTEWNERVKSWYKPMSFDERISWLHANQIRGSNNGPEQFIFFLDLADRHGESKLFDSLPDHTECQFTLKSYQSLATMKARLSKKAFTILCSTFFADYEEGQGQFPIGLQYQEPLFSKLLWFLRSFGGVGGFDNLRQSDCGGLGKDGGSHYLEVARKFAQRFVLDAWQILNRRWYKLDDGEKPNPTMAWLHFREIVILMRRFDLLENVERGQYGPTVQTFNAMVGMVLEENKVFYLQTDLGSESTMRRHLEHLTKCGDALAKVLYIARLNVKQTEMDKMFAI